MSAGLSLFGERKDFVYERTVKSTNVLLSAFVRGIDVKCVLEREEVNRLYVEHVWPSSIVLSDYLCDNPQLVKGKVVVELGAGAALPSIVADKLGARITLVTDFPDRDILENIDDVLRINKCQSAVSVGHKWGEEVDSMHKVILTNTAGGAVDVNVILLADVLWRDTYPHHADLLKSVANLLSDTDGIVLIGIAHRPCEGHSPDQDMEFISLASSNFGLLHEKVLSTCQYADAMESDPIEVHLYKLYYPPK